MLLKHLVNAPWKVLGTSLPLTVLMLHGNSKSILPPLHQKDLRVQKTSRQAPALDHWLPDCKLLLFVFNTLRNLVALFS